MIRGTVTTRNALQIADGTAVMLVTNHQFANSHGLNSLAHIGMHKVVGVDPHEMGYRSNTSDANPR